VSHGITVATERKTSRKQKPWDEISVTQALGKWGNLQLDFSDDSQLGFGSKNHLK
jgi:hypothetical protein